MNEVTYTGTAEPAVAKDESPFSRDVLLIAVGGLFFLGLLIFDRQTLETEPGDVDVFKH